MEPRKQKKEPRKDARGLRFPPAMKEEILDVQGRRGYSTFTNTVVYLVGLGLAVEMRRQRAEDIGTEILEKEEAAKEQKKASGK